MIVPAFAAVLDVSVSVGTTAFPTGIVYVNTALADWPIAAVIVVSLFLDNWPEKYILSKNLLVRSVVVLLLGAVLFLTYYPTLRSLLLGPGNPWSDNPTESLLRSLWSGLLFAYGSRRWPVYRAIE